MACVIAIAVASIVWYFLTFAAANDWPDSWRFTDKREEIGGYPFTSLRPITGLRVHQLDHCLVLLRLQLLSCRFESSPTPKHGQYYLDKKNNYFRIVLIGYGAD